MIRFFTFSALLFSMLCSSLFAQTDAGYPIQSLLSKEPLKNPERIVLPSFDLDKCLREDALNEQDKIGPWRFGYEHRVQYNLQNSGQWDELSNGDRIWRLHLHSSEALSLNLVFDEFALPENSSLHLYNPMKTEILGAYTAKNNNSESMLGTELILGDELIIEYYEPKAQRGQTRLQLGLVVHGYRSLAQKAEAMLKGLNDAGKCNYDVNCPLGNGWQNQINAVALILLGGSTCSGTLINNTAVDGRPFFLTANHCLGASVATWVFRFNWDSPTPVCAANAPSSSPPSPFNSVNGSVLRASRAASDMALLELNSAPTGSIYYAGWNRSTTPALNVMGIHHPSGDVKKICRAASSPTTATWNGAATWRVASWTQGVTEPGSSGSALFDENKRIVGQLYGGGAACTFSTSTSNNGQPDYYGRLSSSWTGGGTNSTRLSNWLDPNSTGVVTLGGYNPNASSPNADAALASLSGVNQNYCGTASIRPVLSLENAGNNTLTEVRFQYSAGSSSQSYTWTGSLAPGATTLVNLPSLSVQGSGQQIFTATILEANGQPDLITNNNTQTQSFQILSSGETVEFSLWLDCYGDETTWEITIPSQNNIVVESGGPYARSTNPPIEDYTFCLDPGCYTLVVYDSYGDGMNGSTLSGCNFDGDYFVLSNAGDTLVRLDQNNLNFGFSNTHTFCITGSASSTEQALELSEAVQVFPNPAKDFVEVLWNFSEQRDLQLELYDARGALLRNWNYKNSQAEQERIDLSNYSSGLYFLRFRSGAGQWTEKLIKN